MKEVTSPIIAIVLVLCAVFVPIAFLGGLTGELYRQFAVTISIAVVISGIVALTLTPALCVIDPQARAQAQPGALLRAGSTAGFARATDRYEIGVAWMIRRGGIGAGCSSPAWSRSPACLWRITPGSLVPDEDQGFYIAAVILPDGATLERTDKVVRRGDRGDPRRTRSTSDVMAFTGFDFLGGGVFRNNAATIFVTQKHWDERKVPARRAGGRVLREDRRTSRKGLALAFPPPPIFGLGTAGGFEFYIQNRGEGGPKRMAEVLRQFIGAAHAGARSSAWCRRFWRANVPQLYVDVDREKAKALGVPLDELFNTLAATLGTYYVNDFNKYGRTWQVLMSAEPRLPQAAGRRRRGLRAQRTKGEMIPLRSLAQRRVHQRPGLARPLQQPAGGEDLRPAARRACQLGRGDRRRSSASRSKVLPPDFSYDWGGASLPGEALGRHLGASRSALGALMVFLILAAQYEKWSLPLSVMLALPFGTFGALAGGLAARGLTNDVYFQIGLVTLLGLAAKNAILIVEYAVMKHEEGLSASAAAVEAARLRFRPILMTSLAFILGVLPLAFSTGAGAGARISAGTGVMGGMLAATFLAIFFVPMFFKLMTDRHLTEKRSSADIKRRGRAARARVAQARVQHPHHAPHRA